MSIHKEGYKIILFGFILLLLFNVLINILISDKMFLKWILGIGSTALFLFLLFFFRLPARKIEPDPGLIYAPADGKVVVIEEVFESEVFKDKRIQVSVFMSPINVHVTRYPISGHISYSKYHPGKYLVAWHPKASEENERTTVVVENDFFGKVLYRQIAGALARRIVNYATLNSKAMQGSDSGFIKFGSRVDLFLPLDADIKVELNQKVRGGECVIAEIK